MMDRVLAVLLAFLGLVASSAGLERLRAIEPARRSAAELLYLPNGKHLKAMSLGQAPLVADVLYLWAIQYYSDYGRKDRYRYVEHVFGGVIPELDPHYVDAYWLGALILTTEANDIEGGLRLLEEGFAKNPDQWVLPYLAAWECHRVGEYQRAADYFERASRVPGAPAFVRRAQAAMVAKSGDLRAALRLWEEVLEDPRSDEVARSIAHRQVRDLQVRADTAELEAAIRLFAERMGRPPARLQDLVRARIIGGLPLDPDGRPYAYDRRTGKVTSEAGRLLRAS